MKKTSLMKRTSLVKHGALTVAVAFLVLYGQSIYSQTEQPPDPTKMIQRRIGFLTRELGLSSAQQQQATTIFTDAATNAKSLHDQMRSAHDSLRAAITKNDSAAIDQAAGSIGNLMAQSIAAHAKADAAFFQTLTPDQQSKYSQMPHHEPGMFGFHARPGGRQPF